jgi:hypothetical protein
MPCAYAVHATTKNLPFSFKLPCCCCCCIRLLQIELIRSAAEPYTASVTKVGRRLSIVAGDTFARMSTAGPARRTKSHFRAE